MNVHITATATIASGDTISNAVDLSTGTIAGLSLPAAFTGTALTFQVSMDGVTFQPLYDSTNLIESVSVVQGRAYSVNPAVFAGWLAVKLISNAAEGAARAVTLALQPVN